MGLFPPKPSRKEERSWRVILKGVPDKTAEESLVRFLKEKLSVSGEDAFSIVRSAPLILFDERNKEEAEKIQAALMKQTGARAAVSRDPAEAKNLPRVVWPKRVSVDSLVKEAAALTPTAPPPARVPPSFKVPPPPPKPPRPAPSPLPTKSVPPPVQEKPAVQEKPPLELPAGPDWKTKYENLQKSYLDAVNRLEKGEAEREAFRKKLTDLEIQFKNAVDEKERETARLKGELRTLLEEKERLARERDVLESRAEGLQKENRELQEKFAPAQQEIGRLQEELLDFQELKAYLRTGEPLLELEKTRTKLESELEATGREKEELATQLKAVERILTQHKPSARAQK